MAITIQTRLHSNILPSSGGGETRIHYEYKTGPRNLLKAIEQLEKHRDRMERRYGNIGCGHTWLEIDGHEIHPHDLQQVSMRDADVFTHKELIKTCSAKAQALINEINAGCNPDRV